jgi:glycosyltransferase involved in cell wall biosynthesis
MPIHAVHFDHLDSSIYSSLLGENQLKVLDEHNIVTNQIITSYKVENNFLLRLLLKSQITKTKCYETKSVQDMDLCFVCSERDGEYLTEFTSKANIKVIPNGVDIQYFSQHQNTIPDEISHFDKSKTLVFVGTLDYGPGETAVLHFLENVYPQLKNAEPEINFVAVGQNPSSRLLKFSNEDIIFTGRVDDIRPYVNNSCIFIVPLLSGSGTRLKILDAMAMKIPVVSTSIGAEGLDVQHENNIMIADTPQDFINCIIQLQRDSELANTIVENGFQLVNNTYGWEIIWKKLLKAYDNTRA